MTTTQLFEQSPITACWNWESPAIPVINERDCIDTVSYLTGITQFEMENKTRRREVVIARQIAMYLICKYTRLSLKSIGEMFGGRDHTTVIHSKNTVCDLLESDPIYFNRFKEIEDMLLSKGLQRVFKKRFTPYGNLYRESDTKPLVRFIDKYSNVKNLYP